MKVFEVVTEHNEGDSKEITKTCEYAASKSDSLLSVTKHYTAHCHEYGKELLSVREVLVITTEVD